MEQGKTDDFTLHLSRAIFRFRYRAGIFFLLSVSLAVLVTAFTPREYRSEAKLFVRLGRENVALDPTATLGEPIPIQVPSSREQEIKTVVELLNNRSLSEQVVRELTPAAVLNPSRGENPESDANWTAQFMTSVGSLRTVLSNWLVAVRLKTDMTERQLAVLTLESNLDIEAVRDTNVITVSYRSPNPEHSRAVVQAIVTASLERHTHINRTTGSHELLAERTEMARNNLTSMEEQIAELKASLNLSAPEDERRVTVEHIGHLESELATALGELSGERQKLLELTNSLETLPQTEVTSQVEGVGDSGTDGMRQQFYALQLREEEMASKYTDSHPALIEVRRQRAAAADILEKNDLTRGQIVRSVSPARQQVQLAILTEQPLLKGVEAKCEVLRQSLSDAKKRLEEIAEAEAKLARLERERELRDIEYRRCVANYEKSQLDEAIEREGISNVAIAQEPSLEARPVFPRPGINLILGLLIGLFGALGVAVVSERLSHSFCTPEEVEDNLQVPTLAVIPRLRPSQLELSKRN